MKKVKVPKSAATKAGKETVSGVLQHGAVKDSQPVGSSENTAPGNEDLPMSVKGGHTEHEQFKPASEAHPLRMRHNKPEGGSLTTSEPSPMYHPGERDKASMDAAKVKKFTRGGEDRIAHPTMSGRDWSVDDGSKH